MILWCQIDIGYEVAGVYMRVLCSCRNMSAAAASCYKATLAVTTGLSAPFSNLAVIYKQQVMAAGLLSVSISMINVPFAIEQKGHLHYSCASLLVLCLDDSGFSLFLGCSYYIPFLTWQGNYSDAISCYNEVLRIEPLAADGLVNRGNTYKEIGRVSEAIQDYINAITIRPNMAEAHANLASAYKDRCFLVSSLRTNLIGIALISDAWWVERKGIIWLSEAWLLTLPLISAMGMSSCLIC